MTTTESPTVEIPTWDQPAYIVVTSRGRWHENGGCHGQGEQLPTEYLVQDTFEDNTTATVWTTTHLIERAERFPTWDEALAASDAWDRLTEDVPGRGRSHVEEYEPRFRNAKGGPALFVNVYRVGQAYGGPEEGGWWFWAGEPYTSVPVEDREAAEAQYEILADRFAEIAVRGQREYEVRIEGYPGEEFPKEHPHYC